MKAWEISCEARQMSLFCYGGWVVYLRHPVRLVLYSRHPERNEVELKDLTVEKLHSEISRPEGFPTVTSLEMTQMQHISTCFTSSGSRATWSKGEISLSLQWHLALASILDFGYDSVWWKKYPFSHWAWLLSLLSIWSANISSMICSEERRCGCSSQLSIQVSHSHEECPIWSWSRWRWSHVSLSYDYGWRDISLTLSSSCSWQGRWAMASIVSSMMG